MSSFKCPFSSCQSEVDFYNQRSFIKHIKQHVEFNHIQLPFLCSQNGCKKTFYDFNEFNRHLNDFHKRLNGVEINFKDRNSTYFSSNDTTKCIQLDNQQNHDEHFHSSNGNENVEHDKFDALKNELRVKVSDLINYFRSKTSLSGILLNEIIHRFGEFVFDLVTIIQIEAFENNIEIKSDKETFFDIVNRPFDFMSTTYKQQSSLEQTGFYIPPRSISIGKRDDISFKDDRTELVQKDVNFQYVSIYETLEALLKNEDFRLTLDLFANNSKDSKYYEENIIFRNKKNLRLLLYYDDLEMCNGLGDVASVYKTGMFYFTITNLTRKNFSSLKNIFLVAICHSDDLKSFGYNKVLDIIMNDVKKVETIGFRIETEVILGSIAQCVGDNLGIHQIFGLKQIFWGERICHLCDASTDKSQKCFKETDFKVIDRIEHQKLIDQEIYAPSSLNKSLYYNIVNNYAFDLTHDLWLGIVPFEMSLVLTSLIEAKYFNLELINSRIKSFDYGLDSKNKPNLLNWCESKIKLKQKAAKMTCLFKLLPFIIGDKIPIGNKYWELLLKLSEIIEILYTESIEKEKSEELEMLIATHHAMFKRLYPGVNLKKKHHNMIHYATAMQKIGSLVNYCTLRFEGKHVFFKSSQRVSHNYKNVPLTLAKKHQVAFAQNLMSSSLINKIIVLDGEMKKVSDLNQNLKKFLLDTGDSVETDTIENVNVIDYYGQIFKKNNLVAYSKIDDMPSFCLILQIIVSKNNVFFSGTEYKAKSFSRHYQAFDVINSKKNIIFNVNMIHSLNPLSFHMCLDQENKSLFLKSPYI